MELYIIFRFEWLFCFVICLCSILEKNIFIKYDGFM